MHAIVSACEENSHNLVFNTERSYCAAKMFFNISSKFVVCRNLLHFENHPYFDRLAQSLFTGKLKGTVLSSEEQISCQTAAASQYRVTI